MLLEFKISNYKSFKDESLFSMKVAPKQKDLHYSILKETIGNVEYKAVCSAVIYGPNASGKTNIIGALDTFKQIILRGHIRNDETKQPPNAATSLLELIPNNRLKTPKPVTFAIEFIASNLLFSYQLSLDLGLFLERDYARKVLFEELKINNKTIFYRDTTVKLKDLSGI